MPNDAPTRRAVTTAAPERVARYLPTNYTATPDGDGGTLIEGTDVAGWTLDGYVLPRLMSGLIGAREVV